MLKTLCEYFWPKSPTTPTPVPIPAKAKPEQPVLAEIVTVRINPGKPVAVGDVVVGPGIPAVAEVVLTRPLPGDGHQCHNYCNCGANAASVADAVLVGSGDVVKCKHCGYSHDADVVICPACGFIAEHVPDLPLVPKCTNCGTVLPASAQFCDNCGQPVDSMAQA